MQSVRFFCLVILVWACHLSAIAGPVISKKKAAAPKKAVAARPAVVKPLQPLRVTPPVDIMHDHSPVTVTGGVTGADGMPLPGATVWLTNTHQAVAVTNAAGDFTFTLPNNATVSLTCGYGGTQQQMVVVVSPNQREGIFFNLPVAATRRRR